MRLKKSVDMRVSLDFGKASISIQNELEVDIGDKDIDKEENILHDRLMRIQKSDFQKSYNYLIEKNTTIANELALKIKELILEEKK